VRGVLAAEDRAGVRHLRLDEAVAHAGADGDAPLLLDQFRDGSRGDEVVDDRGARVLVQLALGDQGGDGGRRDRLATLVHHEAPVGVTVEGRPMSAPLDLTSSCRSTMFAGSTGLASWLGESPPSTKYRGTISSGRPPSTAGTVWPPIPLPASTATVSGRMPVRSTSPRRNSP